MLQALRDLADPAEGVYNATALLETRLSYVKMMLDKYQKLPSSRPGMAPAATLAVPAPSEEVSSNTLLNRAVTAIQDGIKDLSPAQEAEAYEASKAESSKKVLCPLPIPLPCQHLRRGSPALAHCCAPFLEPVPFGKVQLYNFGPNCCSGSIATPI